MKVPQFVAGWMNYCKLTGVDLYHAFEMSDLYLGNYAYQKDYPKLKDYFESENNQETFARAWLNGYTVEENVNNDLNLMQSTGLKDKNGKEIFEGDIITNDISVVDVKNHQTLGFYTVVNGEERFFGSNTSIKDFENDVEEFSSTTKIIGNIYENPELLEVEL